MRSKQSKPEIQSASANGRNQKGASGSGYDAGQGVRRFRKEPWADGFLTSHGTQMPLFNRSARLFKIAS